MEEIRERRQRGLIARYPIPIMIASLIGITVMVILLLRL